MIIYAKSSTSRLVSTTLITAWIFSLGPSDKYEIAQQVSANTSPSRLWRSWLSTGNAGATWMI